MKKALVTSRIVLNHWEEAHYAVSRNLIDYLKWCGYSTIILHAGNMGSLQNIFDSYSPDLVVLSGGESLGDDPDRDAFEVSLLRLSEKYIVPVLGICRGMQMLGFYFDQAPSKLTGHVGVRHGVTGSLNVEVNSFHHFGFGEIFHPLVSLARGEDNSVEAFKHQSLPWLGIMWHPERDAPTNWINVLGLRE